MFISIFVCLLLIYWFSRYVLCDWAVLWVPAARQDAAFATVQTGHGGHAGTVGLILETYAPQSTQEPRHVGPLIQMVLEQEKTKSRSNFTKGIDAADSCACKSLQKRFCPNFKFLNQGPPNYCSYSVLQFRFSFQFIFTLRAPCICNKRFTIYIPSKSIYSQTCSKDHLHTDHLLVKTTFQRSLWVYFWHYWTCI